MKLRGEGKSIKRCVWTSFCFVILTFALLGSVRADETTLNVSGPIDPELHMPAYKIGETVEFTGTGYSPGQYNISLSTDEVNVTFVLFEVAEGDDIVPDGTEWKVPFNVPTGVYKANVTNVDDKLTELAEVLFYVNASSGVKLEYLLDTPFEELIKLLKDNAEDLATLQSLNRSLENIKRKVENASQLLAEGKTKQAMNQLRAARNMLTAFIHKVTAQSTNQIDPALAKQLLEKALLLLGQIDSMMPGDFLPTGKGLALNVRRTILKQELHLNEFVLRKALDDAVGDDEFIALVNSTINNLMDMLNQTKGKMEMLAASDLNLTELAMQIEDLNDTATQLLHLYDVVMNQMEERGRVSPGLAKKIQALISAGQETNNKYKKDLNDIRGKALGRREDTPPGQNKDKGNGGGHGN